MAVLGSSETVRARIAEDMTGSGCNYFVGRYAFGDVTLAQVLRSVELMKSEVIPHFAGSSSQASAKAVA